MSYKAPTIRRIRVNCTAIISVTGIEIQSAQTSASIPS